MRKKVYSKKYNPWEEIEGKEREKEGSQPKHNPLDELLKTCGGPAFSPSLLYLCSIRAVSPEADGQYTTFNKYE